MKAIEDFPGPLPSKAMNLLQLRVKSLKAGRNAHPPWAVIFRKSPSSRLTVQTFRDHGIAIMAHAMMVREEYPCWSAVVQGKYLPFVMGGEKPVTRASA